MKATAWISCRGLWTWPDWQTDRHRAMSHAGMTTAWSPQQPPEKLTYQPVNTDQPWWSTCLSRATPSSEYHVPTCTHINIQTHTQGIVSLVSSWSRYRGWAITPLSHIRAQLYWWDYITPSHDTPLPPTHLHVIRFQEHWAHKPGHVLLCPVCQNNSAVSNTVRLWFHFSLPRYCRTLQCVTFLMSTRLQFDNMYAGVNLWWVKSRHLGGLSMRMILWNLWPFETVCYGLLWVTMCQCLMKATIQEKQRGSEEETILSGSKGSSAGRWYKQHMPFHALFTHISLMNYLTCACSLLYCSKGNMSFWKAHKKFLIALRKMMMLMISRRRWKRREEERKRRKGKSGRKMTRMSEVMVWLYPWCVAWLFINIVI